MDRTRTGLSPTPRTAVIWAALRGELRRSGQALRVIDVGGGTGGFAVPLAEAGHHVTVIDASPDALASLTRRAAEAGVVGLIDAVQGDGDQLADLVSARSADVVLCHSVLEEVDDPAAVMSAIAGVLRPGGVASVVVANRVGAVLARALAGHFSAATELVVSSESVAVPAARPQPAAGSKIRRRFDAAGATALVEAAGFTVEAVHGVRVIADLIPGTLADTDAQGLLDFELATADLAPYRDVATQLHLLARRTG